MAAVIGLAGKAVGALIAKHKQLRQEIDQSTISFDTVFTKFAVQAGLSRKELVEFENRFFQLSKKFGIKPEVAAQAATEFVSQGGELPGVRGLPIEEIIKTAKATSATSAITELTKAMVGTIKNLGQELNEDNLARLKNQIVGLFAKTTFQASDLSILGRNIALLQKVNVDQETQFAIFETAKSIAGEPSTAATALKGIVINFTVAATKPRLVGLLAKGGLTPADIDLVGETFNEVLDKIDKFTKELDKSQVLPFLKELVGKNFIGIFAGLLKRRGEIAEKISIQRDPEATAIRLRTATTGPAVERTRVEGVSGAAKFGKDRELADIKVFESFMDKFRKEKGLGTLSALFSEVEFFVNKIISGGDVRQAGGVTVFATGGKELLLEFREFKKEMRQSSELFKTSINESINTNKGQEKAQIKQAEQAEKLTDFKEVKVTE